VSIEDTVNQLVQIVVHVHIHLMLLVGRAYPP
jgi:hypothetical protein